VLRRLTDADTHRLIAGYLGGHTLEQLAVEYGVHRRTVAAHLQRHGVARRVIVSKMTPADIDAAAHRYQVGESLAAIAETFQVNPATVGRNLKQAGVALRLRRGW